MISNIIIGTLSFIIVVQSWYLWKMWNKILYWEHTYKKVKRAHAHIVEGLMMRLKPSEKTT